MEYGDFVRKLLWLVPVVIGVAMSVVHPDDWDRPYFPDGASDKYTALAAWTGGDPYQPMDRLAAEYGFYPTGHPAPHPRPPAALLVQGPMVFVADSWIIPVMSLLSVAAVTFVFWGAARLSRFPASVFVAAAAVYLAASDYWYASSGLIVAPLIVGGWLLLERRPEWAGGLLGVATAVKLWPLAVVVALLTRSGLRRAGLWGVATAVGLTTVGLLLPGASVDGTLTAGSTAAYFFSESSLNMSLPGVAVSLGVPLIVGSAAAGLLWLFGIRAARNSDELVGWAVVAGICASPVAWGTYWLAAIPVAAMFARALVDTRPRVSCQPVGWS